VNDGVTIQAFWLRCKALAEEGIGQFGTFLVLILAVSAAFGLGKLSSLEDVKPTISIQEAPQSAQALALSPGGYVVASRSGSVYYLPWCSGAEKMAEGNQVWFPSEAAAQKAGYTPSKSCKGL
jgi:Metal binding domain of Ada